MADVTRAPGRGAGRARGGLIEREPRAVRPPYDVRDDSLRALMLSDVEACRQALRADRLAALLEPLEGLEISGYERRILEDLARREIFEVTVVVALLHRARAAAPLFAGDAS